MVVFLSTEIGDDLETTASSSTSGRMIGLPSAGDELEIKWSGLLLAVAAFVVTRFVVVDVVYNPTGRPTAAVLGGLVPLVVGLGVVAYGVSVAVSTHSRAFANRIAVWYLVGSAGMVVVVGGSLLGAGPSVETGVRSSVFAAAVTAGGFAGVLFGRHTSLLSDYRREVERQNDRALLLNRLLRHEILNSLTAIRGHTDLIAEGTGGERSEAAVEANSDRIERTVREVGFLVRTLDEQAGHLESVSLGPVLERCQRSHSDGRDDVRVRDETSSVTVRADDQVGKVFDGLIDLALERTEDRAVTLTVTADATTVAVRIAAPGRWLDDAERVALVEGLPEFDGPRVDYGLSIAQVLVEHYGGSIEAADADDGTAISITLPRTDEDRLRPNESPGVAGGAMRVAVAAGLVAGIAMGLVLHLSTGQMAVIGGLYNVPTATVGWITHLFHSVVFAILFAAVVSRNERPGGSPRMRRVAAVGLAYSLLLWVVAGGIVMSVWLTLMGIPSPIPNLGVMGLLGHLVWGVILVGSYAVLSDVDMDPRATDRSASTGEPGHDG